MSSRGLKRGAGPSTSHGSDEGFTEPTPVFKNKLMNSHYKAIVNRSVKPTKFVCRDSFVTLGVFDGVRALFANIGWENFLNHWALTYHTPTLEILASLARDDDARILTFRFAGTAYRLSFERLNEHMGTPARGNHCHIHSCAVEGYNENEFWQRISGLDDFRPKSAHIIHPCLRLAHRILCCTIFARTECSQITKLELFFLWCMTSRDADFIPDFASHFLHKCISTRDTRTAPGDICFGGLFTVMLSAPEISQSLTSPPWTIAVGPTRLDLAALGRMSMISPRPPGRFIWYHSIPREPYLYLPDARIAEFRPLRPFTWRLTPHLPEDDVVNEGDAPMEENPPSPPAQGETQFPPDFSSRFDRLCLQSSQYATDLQSLRQQQEAMSRRQETMSTQLQQLWEYHSRQGHFHHPPPDPPM